MKKYENTAKLEANVVHRSFKEHKDQAAADAAFKKETETYLSQQQERKHLLGVKVLAAGQAPPQPKKGETPNKYITLEVKEITQEIYDENTQQAEAPAE